MPRQVIALFSILCTLYASAALGAAVSDQDKSINRTYVELGHAVFEDALLTARDLLKAVDQLIATPSETTLAAARQAWRQARIPYAQSESFRFSNALVDDTEARINSWPLDEGLIDYVSDSYFYELGNVAAQLNIIANPVIDLGAGVLDTTELTPETLASFNELGGSAANVATGYHAIEFLLWGQDLNGTGPGAGERPASDYAKGDDCTHGNCQRRGQYLHAATQLLVDDLDKLVQQLNPEGKSNYAQQLLSAPPEVIMAKIFFSIGSLSLGEMAGERMKVALEANSSEDEQDCFSDNTHWAHYYDAVGIRNLYQGEYRRVDGRLISGPSAADYAKEKAPEQHRQLQTDIDGSLKAIQRIVDAAESSSQPMKFDQMIAEGNPAGKRLLREAINALVKQTESLEALSKQLGIDPSTANQL